MKAGDQGLHLSQTQYLVNLLKSYNLENLKPSVTPMVSNQCIRMSYQLKMGRNTGGLSALFNT